MLTSEQAAKQRTRKRIDILLESGVDLDQIALIESESFSGSKLDNEKCYEILRKVASYAVENAKKIQEARELILTIG